MKLERNMTHFTCSPIMLLCLRACVKLNLAFFLTNLNLPHFGSYKSIILKYVKCILSLSNFISPSYMLSDHAFKATEMCKAEFSLFSP